MNRVLVIGAAGFAGGYLVSELLSRGIDVIGTYYRTPPPHHATTGAVEWIRCDVRDTEAVRNAVRAAQPEGIIHLAAMSIPVQANANPIEAYATNVGGCLNIFEAVRAAGLRCKLVLISSCHVYGRQTPGPHGFTEDLPPKPHDVYGATRAAAELLAEVYGTRHQFDVVVARSFNHCGPGQNPNYFIATLTQQVARIALGQSEPEICLGSLRVVRDFTDVRDVVRAYAALLERGSPGEVYNVCSGERVALQQVVETLREIAGCDLEIRTDPSRIRKAESPILFGNPALLRRATGWSPTFSLDETLSDMLDYWKKRLGAASLLAVG